MTDSKHKISILYEDEHLLALDKPAGVVVNRAKTVTDPTLQDWFEVTYPDLIKKSDLKTDVFTNEFQQRSGMVHRLDKDTSGVLLWAKNPKTMQAMMRLFKQRQIRKTYQALVHGIIQLQLGSISLPLDRSPKDRTKFGVVVGGKLTETDYRVLRYFDHPHEKKYQGFTLLELYPKTGRTHQLRVVLKHLHHPIVSDHVYAGRKRSRLDQSWCPRQFLHAAAVSFKHPLSEQSIQIHSNLSADLEKSIAELEARDVEF